MSDLYPIPIYLRKNGFVKVENEATKGAKVGENLYDSDGTLITSVGGGGGGSGTIGCTFDGGGAAIVAGSQAEVVVPYDCTITKATLLADQIGSIVIDVWKDTYTNYPPNISDSITAAAAPTISGAVKSQDSTLTGWTTAITAGDVVKFNVYSCSVIERATILLEVTKL